MPHLPATKGKHPARQARPAAGAEALVHPIYARLLRMLLQQSAIDSDRVLAAAALDWNQLLTTEQRLPRDTVIRLVQAAMQATGKPWLGLELGDQAPVSAHGPLGYAAVTAPDLQHCLMVLGRYGPVREDSFSWSFQMRPEGGTLQVIDRLDWGSARSFVLDTMAAALVRVLHAAVGSPPAGLRLDVPLPRPAWVAHYERALPLPLQFGQPTLALHVPAAALRLPLLGADARAHAAACHECDAALAELVQSSMAQRVASLLGHTAEGSYPRLPDIAAQCEVSERTLMRRLALEGTSFQQLLDAHQQSRTLWLLQHTSDSVEDIAGRLGYTDTSNFSRTVKRWFGHTPSALRKGTLSTAPA
ncbi:DNA binding HTH domain, AraC-type [Comamonadaceae bacterium]